MGSVIDLIQSELPHAFLLGFSAGFVIMAAVAGIRSAVKLFKRIATGRT